MYLIHKFFYLGQHETIMIQRNPNTSVFCYFCAVLFVSIYISDANSTDLNDSNDPHQKPKQKILNDFKKRKCVESDLFCRTPDLLEKYGYLVETHKVVTRDGFILVAHRIPGGRSDPPMSSPPRRRVSSYLRRPVILAHALLCSSSDWLMNTPNKALAYMLADAGLDVWILNSRGNSYSSEHLHYTDNQSEYWDWSFHEMGTLDLPKWIDYILNVTGHPDLYYIGHSMGSTQFFIGMSEKPEYNKKIRKMFALAPAVYITNSRYWLFAKMAPLYGKVIEWLGAFRFVPETFRTWLNILGYGCTTVEPFCDNFIFFIVGYNAKQTNSTQTAIIASHTPDNVSSKVISHYLQIMKEDRFQKYDHGYLNNGLLYNGQTTPPEYNVTKITAPIVIFHSENDVFANPEDVQKFAKQLVNLQQKNLVEDPLFTHIDFTYAIDADKYVYNKIIDIIIDEEDKENS